VVTKTQRLQFVNNFLSAMHMLRPLVASSRNERVFELFCYFRKVDELTKRGKTPLLQNIRNHRFVPHSKPGNPLSASYISFQEAKGETFDLFLNAKFQGRSGAEHSPDIVLRETRSEKILSIYECKNHSGTLGLNYYREFVGYLEEMRIPKRRHNLTFRNLYPELRPCIYTSAIASPSSNQMRNQYDFDVIEQL